MSACAQGHLRSNCHSCPDGPCQRPLPAELPVDVAVEPPQPAARPHILATRRFAAVAAVGAAAAQLLIGKVI